MTTKAKLMEILQKARVVERALVIDKSEIDLSVRGTVEEWSIKDIVAHIMYWRKQLVGRLEAIQKGERPVFAGSQEALDAINDQAFTDYKEIPWVEIWSESVQVFSRVLELIDQFSEQELFDPGQFEWLEGQPLWRNITENSFAHPLAHISDFYLDLGEREKAIENERFSTEIGLGMDDSPIWRGAMWYNLACFYIKIEDFDAALTLLQEAFILNPELKAWGKQDSDLDPLRQNPDFEALYDGE